MPTNLSLFNKPIQVVKYLKAFNLYGAYAQRNGSKAKKVKQFTFFLTPFMVSVTKVTQFFSIWYFRGDLLAPVKVHKKGKK